MDYFEAFTAVMFHFEVFFWIVTPRISVVGYNSFNSIDF
jgi:hypothetical protein